MMTGMSISSSFVLTSRSCNLLAFEMVSRSCCILAVWLAHAKKRCDAVLPVKKCLLVIAVLLVIAIIENPDC